jgi:hypothetical protein
MQPHIVGTKRGMTLLIRFPPNTVLRAARLHALLTRFLCYPVPYRRPRPPETPTHAMFVPRQAIRLVLRTFLRQQRRELARSHPVSEFAVVLQDASSRPVDAIFVANAMAPLRMSLYWLTCMLLSGGYI